MPLSNQPRLGGVIILVRFLGAQPDAAALLGCGRRLKPLQALDTAEAPGCLMRGLLSRPALPCRLYRLYRQIVPIVPTVPAPPVHCAARWPRLWPHTDPLWWVDCSCCRAHPLTGETSLRPAAPRARITPPRTAHYSPRGKNGLNCEWFAPAACALMREPCLDACMAVGGAAGRCGWAVRLGGAAGRCGWAVRQPLSLTKHLGTRKQQARPRL